MMTLLLQQQCHHVTTTSSREVKNVVIVSQKVPRVHQIVRYAADGAREVDTDHTLSQSFKQLRPL